MSQNLVLHLFTKLHRILALARDQRGKIISDGQRTEKIVRSILLTILNVVQGPEELLDREVLAVFESLMVSLLSFVQHFTSNLEEAGQLRPGSPFESLVLRQTIAQILYHALEEDTTRARVSSDFKCQLAEVLFQWLYHSGVRGRFLLYSETAARAAAAARDRQGFHATPQQSSNDYDGLDMETSMVRALRFLMDGLQLKEVSAPGRVAIAQSAGTPAMQSEHLFRSFFHTLSRLLVTAQSNGQSDLGDVTALCLCKLLGSNLDVSFRKYINEAERLNYNDDSNTAGKFILIFNLHLAAILKSGQQTFDATEKKAGVATKFTLVEIDYEGQLDRLEQLLTGHDNADGHKIICSLVSLSPVGAEARSLADAVTKVFLPPERNEYPRHEHGGARFSEQDDFIFESLVYRLVELEFTGVPILRQSPFSGDSAGCGIIVRWLQKVQNIRHRCIFYK